jgi:hypothetical protein
MSNHLQQRTRGRWSPASAVLSIVLGALAISALGTSAAYAQERAIGDFSLVSQMHGKCIEVRDVIFLPAENVPLTRMLRCGGTEQTNQRWTYSATTGEFKIYDNTCLDAYKARRGDPIMIYPCRSVDPRPGQRWDIDDRGRIVLRDVVGPEGQRYCVTIANGDRSDGARLWLQSCHGGENQMFRRDSEGQGGSTVSIESHLRSPSPLPACVTALHPPVRGAAVAQWRCFGSDYANQRWVRTSEMQFILAHTKGSSQELCLDGDSGTYNSPVTIQVCQRGAVNQKWNMLGYGELQLQDGNKLCLTTPYDSNANGNTLVMAGCNTSISNGQRWSYRDPGPAPTA